MTEPERLVRFELLGQEFTFYTAASEAEMAAILSLMRELVEVDSVSTRSTIPTGKVAILACLNIASRYVKLQQEFASYKEDTENRFARLCRDIQIGLSAE